LARAAVWFDTASGYLMDLRIAADRGAAPDRGRHRWFRAASGWWRQPRQV